MTVQRDQPLRNDSHRGRQAEYFDQVQYRDARDPVISAYAQPKLDFIRSHLELDGKILDVGCGNGIFTLPFADAGATVVGLDSSRYLLRQNPHHKLICGDALHLPFKDGSFDVVFEGNVLHHVEERDRVIQEMTRVSRRHIILIEPNRYNVIMAAFSVLVPAERGGLKSCVSRLKTEVERSNLRVVASVTTGMISQNNTPRVLLPWLRKFDRPIWWGEYIVVIAEKLV
jgi:ubiquinone/menaquinone biosynthesis C-methylase UbiE